jgi:phosphate transport system substrate-binding protein
VRKATGPRRGESIRRIGSGFALLGLVLGLASCGGSDDLDGTVVISGSSTVQPVISQVAGHFVSDHPLVSVDLDAPGTGEGFLLFCDEQTDMNNASRSINPVELRTCRENGVKPILFDVARDAAVIVTSERSRLPKCLTFDQLYELAGPEAGGAENWKVASGGGKQVPKGKFTFVSPEATSGTAEVFTDLVLSDPASLNGQPAELRRDVTSVASDQLVGDTVRSTPGAIGLMGYSIASTQKGLRTIALDDGDGCVKPERETIETGSYPLTRSLLVYVNPARAKADPTVNSFVDYLVSGDLADEAVSAGAIPAPDYAIEANRTTWEDAGS